VVTTRVTKTYAVKEHKIQSACKDIRNHRRVNELFDNSYKKKDHVLGIDIDTISDRESLSLMDSSLCMSSAEKEAIRKRDIKE
jgi:hypothetical protein